MALKSGNPALSVKTFEGLGESAEPMTLPGTINKAAMLLAILLIGAGWVWNLYFASHQIGDISGYLWAGIIGGFAVGLVTIFNKRVSPYTSPLYALLEGFAIGHFRGLRGEVPRHYAAGSRAHHGHFGVHARRLPL